MQHRIKNKNIKLMIGDCAVCGPKIPIKMNYRGYIQCRIKLGQDNAKRAPKRKRNKDYKYKPDRIVGAENKKYSHYFEKFMKEQNGKCKICKEDMVRPHLDHDHDTNKIRGLLCHKCNVGIGFLQDNPVIIKSALEYLSYKIC